MPNKDLTDSDVWGGPAWFLIHNVTRHLVKQNPQDNEGILAKEAVEDFFMSLAVLLPCSVCQTNYRQKLSDDSFCEHLDKWEDLDVWGFELHNKVNKMLEKKEMSLDTYKKMYQKVDKKKSMEFIKILEELYIEEVMAISEIQNLKTMLNSLVVLNPTRKIYDQKRINKEKERVCKIYNYQTLRKYFHEEF